MEEELWDQEQDEEDVTDRKEQSERIEFIVDEENSGIRIDKYLSLVKSELSRSYIQKLIEEGLVMMDQKPVKANFKVKTGTGIVLILPELKEAQIAAEDLPIDIIYEDKDIIVINKQKGLVVHPAAGHYTGTLVNALLFHC
jgi:23S rRNA pseudouridine1911/1915/1917 synthase